MSRCGKCPVFHQSEYGVECPGYISTEGCAETLQLLYCHANEYTNNLKQSLAEKIKENKELKDAAAPAVLDQIPQRVEALSTQMDNHVKGLAPDGYPVKFNTFGQFRFTGANNSMGLVYGQIYWLAVYRLDGQNRIWVEWKTTVDKKVFLSVFNTPRVETLRCPYDSAQLFEKNWKCAERGGIQSLLGRTT